MFLHACLSDPQELGLQVFRGTTWVLGIVPSASELSY